MEQVSKTFNSSENVAIHVQSPLVKSRKIEELLKSKQKTTKVGYDAILQSVASEPTKAQSRWCDELSMPGIQWQTYYRIPFCCTIQTKLRSFQYKIYH